MASGEEIQQALRAFVAKWSGYTGSERAEAQTYLNELVACYGWPRSAAQDAGGVVRPPTERNREIVEDARPYNPFGSAGGAVAGRRRITSWRAGSRKRTSRRCARRRASTTSARLRGPQNAGGGNVKGLCPFHDEKSPTFNVTPSRGMYTAGR